MLDILQIISLVIAGSAIYVIYYIFAENNKRLRSGLGKRPQKYSIKNGVTYYN